MLDVLIKDTNLDVRWSAARALGKIGNDQTIDSLLIVLKDTDSSVRWSVAEALGAIGSERAIDGLLNVLLKDTDRSARRSAAEALEKIGSECEIDSFLVALKDTDFFVRRSAAKVLGRIGSERALDGLLNALKDADSSVRWGAVAALGEIGSPVPLPNLWQLLCHEPYGDLWGKQLWRTISNIQSRCQFYNYEIFQTHLAAQKGDLSNSQNCDRSSTIINNYPNVTEVKQTIMSNSSKYNFPAAQKVQIFEQVTTYIENNHPTDPEVKTAIADLTLLLTQLQTQHPQVTTESQALTILDAEFTEIQQSPTHPLVTLRQQLLNPERHLQAIKATFTEVVKHYIEESVWSKAAITYLDKLSETPDQGG